MDYNYVMTKWNEQADGFNTWDNLSDDEKVDYAITLAAHKAATLIKDPVEANNVAEQIMYT